jgi:hypothetical protein
MKIVMALIAASVLLLLGLAIAQYAETGYFSAIELSASIGIIILSGIPYRARKPRARKSR